MRATESFDKPAGTALGVSGLGLISGLGSGAGGTAFGDAGFVIVFSGNTNEYV